MSQPPDHGLGLAVPDARQGPGPMPAALIGALDPAVNRLVARTMPGVRRATGVGVGTELAQLRPYETGDDVRHLDAAASARTATLHVRLHVPERALTTWLVLDLSPSMAFGTARRLKADVAAGVALVFARLGVRRAGSVGVVAFGFAGPVGPGDDGGGRLGAHAGGHGIRVLAPRGSQPGMVALRRLLEAGVAPDRAAADRAAPDRAATDRAATDRAAADRAAADRAAPDRAGPRDELAFALGRTLRLATQPGLVVVVSDFRDQHGWERPLGALGLRHTVIAAEVHDPREGELPNVGRLAVVDPESGELLRVNTASRRLRERFSAIEAERRAGVSRELRRLGIRHVGLGTDGDWLRELGKQIRTLA